MRLVRMVLLFFAIVAWPESLAVAQSCQTMNANNTFISYSGPKSGCSPYPNAPPCQAGESLNLSVQFFAPYDPSCATHNYNWSFGGNTQAVAHAFNATTPIYVNISNGAQTFQATATVTVSGTQPPPPSGACQQMNSSDVFVTYNGPQSGCSYSNSTPCSASEQVSLGVAFFPPYDIGCATHSFTWSFGASGQNVTHQFPSSSQVSVSINNGSQTYSATTQIPVGSSTQPPPGSCGTLIPGTSVFVSYTGPQSGCTAYSGTCSTSETLPFTASTFAPFSASCISAYDWNFGDGTPHGSTASVSHRYVTAGSYPLKLTVTYSGQPYVITQTVNVSNMPVPPPPPPPPSCNANPIVIAPSTLPAAQVGQVYTQTLSATGGVAPYSYSLAAGSFPPGVTITGTSIFGTPVAAGSYSFSVKATDSISCVGIIPLSLTVVESTCPDMLPGVNVLLKFSGPTSECTDESESPCLALESIAFSAAGSGYDFSCMDHTFIWTFGDGQIGAGKHITHTYLKAGTYAVSLVISNSRQLVQLTANAVVVEPRRRAARH